MRRTCVTCISSLLAIALASFPPNAWGSLFPGGSFDQIDFFGNNGATLSDSEWGLYRATVSPSASMRYVNVFADGGTAGDIWLVQNLPVPSVSVQPDPITMYTAFDLQPLGFLRGTQASSLSVHQEITSSPLTAPLIPSYSTVTVGDFNYDAEGKKGAGGLHSDPGSPVMGSVSLSFGGLFDFHWRSNVPNVEQGADECGPVQPRIVSNG